MLMAFLGVTRIQGCFHWPSNSISPICSEVMTNQKLGANILVRMGVRG